MNNTPQTISALTPKYIEIVKSEKENSELYKWEAIKHFQKNWDIEADDFQSMFAEAFKKKENLIYHNSFGFLNKLAQNFPEELRSLFRNLFDESKDLAKRIQEHQEKSEGLLEKLKAEIERTNISHQQDERTISFLLVLKFPEKHFLYKSNVYEAFCKHIGAKQKKAGEKLFHFEELCRKAKNEVANNSNFQDFDFYKQVQKDFNFDPLHLIIQDIIYRTLIVDKADKMGYNENDFEFYIQTLKEITEKLKIKQGDPRIVFSRRENRYSFIVGQRYAFVYYENKPQDKFGVLSNLALIEEFEEFDGNQPKAYFNYMDQSLISDKVVQHLVSAVSKELERANKSSYLKYNNRNFEQLIYPDTPMEKENKKRKNHATNQIIFGPPGTGKTYSTVDKVAEICSPEEFKLDNHSNNKLIYNQLLEEGKVFFTTFHQSFGYEDFIEGIKPIPPKIENESITYEVEDGIFKSICEQCLDEILEIKAQNESNINNNLSFKEKYNEFVQRIQKGLVTVQTRNGLQANVSRVSASGNMRLKTGKDTNDYIISASRLEKLVEKIPKPKSLKNIQDEVREIIGGSNTTLYYAALEAFVDFEKKLEKDIKEVGKDLKLKDITLSEIEISELPKYVLIIDEINRGNVSAIFGELITLLEEDKRFGMSNQLFARLPYSKSNFIVPPNLYIIGTMNTADRSVEALDTALRRRFSFQEMMPNPELLTDIVIEGINLAQLLTTINERIEVLVDRDHIIGHSYFLNVKTKVDLKNIFKDKVIPLLQEYFFGDYSKMEMVIGSYFFMEKLNKVTFAVSNDNYFEERKRYVFKDFDQPDFDIITALKGLLGIKEENKEE